MASAIRSRVAGMVASWSKAAHGQTIARAFGTTVSQPEVAHTTTAAAAESAAPAAPRVPENLSELSNDQILQLLRTSMISPHRLETDVGDVYRAVQLRRAYVVEQLGKAANRVAERPAEAMNHLPTAAFDHDAFYRSIMNTNCEAVIGYVPLPVGVVGPLLLDGKLFYVPMATTEGALIASTNRGCAAIRRAGGASTALLNDGMTRAPLVRMGSLKEAADLKNFVENPENLAMLATAFNSTSRFGRLKTIQATVAGRNVYLRCKCTTGDAMGMNMITKGVSEVLNVLHRHFPAMRVLALSGNFCTDKKPSAVNWIDGRGKSVSAEVRLSGRVIKNILKTNAEKMVELNTAKNLVGSALAGSIGGFNAHASNIVTAVFLATGQDGAQNVESSTCMTLMELDDSIEDPEDPTGECGRGLVMTVTMPSIEVGTVGGGTSLPAQSAALSLLGVKGASQVRPGLNSETLARVVAGSVLAGELSLMSALTTNDLLTAHMKLNRKHGDQSSAGLALTSEMLRVLGSHGHGHGHSHGGHGHSHPRSAGAAAVYAGAAAAGLAERVQYTTVYTPADGSSPSTSVAASSTMVGSSSGAAAAHSAATPLGAHPHPLHLASATSSGPTIPHTSVSPGRRYFAAPTGNYSRAIGLAGAGSGASRFSPATSSTSTVSGVDEESRSMPAVLPFTRISAARAAWDHDEEPCLPVP